MLHAEQEINARATDCAGDRHAGDRPSPAMRGSGGGERPNREPRLGLAFARLLRNPDAQPDSPRQTEARVEQ